VEVNLAEAKHSSIFGGGALHSAACSGDIWGEGASLDASQLMQLVLAMLGFGGLRTWEKKKEIARK